MSRFVPALLAAAALALPASLAAQAPASSGVSLPTAKNNVVSIQPLNAVFTLYQGEFERKLSPTVTLGVGATYWGADDEFTDESTGEELEGDLDYVSGDVKLRYYPGAKPFQGFSFGVQGGFTRISGRAANNTTGENEEASATGPSFGVALDYNWLLGASKSFYVGLGVGAKAAFVDDDELEADATLRYPTARVSIGWAF